MRAIFFIAFLFVACSAAAQTPEPLPVPAEAHPVVDRATLDDPQLQRGYDVFVANCGHCHSQGRGMPGTQSLAVKYGDALPALLEERTDLTPELVTFFVRNGVGAMAPYRKTEIGDAELADLAAYLSRPRS